LRPTSACPRRKAVAAMTGQNLDAYLGRAFEGDGLATIVARAGGGTGVTTYAENIGVMAVTKVYSTLLFVVAALFAFILGFSPKFGAFIMTILGPVLGGLSTVVFGLITATGGRIWVQNRVDFSRARNLVTAAVTLTLGAGDLALRSAASRSAASARRRSARSRCISFSAKHRSVSEV
jgi:putative pyrimidine permease RutG